MTELSLQYGCSPAKGDYGDLTHRNLATMRLFLGNYTLRESGVVWWTDQTYLPVLETTSNPSGLSGSVGNLLEPTEAGGVVTINTGVGLVNGFLYFNDDTVDFDINSNVGNANATDIIALQLLIPDNQVRLVRLNGGVGVKAVLTQDSTTWEVPIAEIQLDGIGQVSQMVDVRKLAMQSGAMINIENIQLTSPQATISFSNIPPIFSSLKLIGTGGSSSATVNAGVKLQFNGDGGLNYTQASLTGRNGVVTTTTGIGLDHILAGTVVGTTGVPNGGGNIYIDIMEYKNTNFIKQANCGTSSIAANVAVSVSIDNSVGWWLNTSVINQIDLTEGLGGNFITNTKVSLYGVV